MFFKNLLSSFKKNKTPYLIYSEIVAAARQERLYSDINVPDTLEGRFEMITLHASLFFCRLQSETPTDRRLGQDVFDVMFADIDYNLREMGVGDLSVGKKIKKLASAFYSRLEYYDEGLKSNSDKKLLKLLKEHHICSKPADSKKLVSYLRSSFATLQKQDMSNFVKGHIQFSNLD